MRARSCTTDKKHRDHWKRKKGRGGAAAAAANGLQRLPYGTVLESNGQIARPHNRGKEEAARTKRQETQRYHTYELSFTRRSIQT